MSQPKQRPPAWAFAASSIRLKPDAVSSTSRIAQPIFEAQQAVADGIYDVLSFHTRGRFASVWLAKNVTNGSQVAIKAIDAKDHSSLAINEVQLLQELGAAHNTSATASPATKAAPPLATSATSSAAPAQIHAQASSATSTTVSMGMPAAGVSTQQHSGPPGIVQLLGTFLHTLPSGQQYRCLVLERLGSTAAEVLAYLGSRSKGKARRGMSTPALKNMTRQLLLALDHCHSRGIIHRDIKPGNIMTSQPLLTPLLSATAYMQATTSGSAAAPAPPQQGTPSSPHPAPPTPHAPAHPGQAQLAMGKVKVMSSAQLASCSWKLIDFGIATRASSSTGSLQGLQQSLLALPGLCQLASTLGFSAHSQGALSYDTPAYAPPEAILELPVTPAYDMWSLGCVVYEMATGSKLFTPAPHCKYSAPVVHLYQMACLLGSPPRKLLTRSNMASEYFDHKGALHMEVDHALHMASVEDMLVAVGGLPAGKARDLADFIEPLLEYDPEQRASAAQMLQHAWLAAE